MDSDASLSEVLSLCAEEHVSRLPVVEDGTVVVTVELRDAVRVSEEGGELADAVVEPLRVEGSLPVDDLLLRMRRNRVRLAVVKDEEGAGQGLSLSKIWSKKSWVRYATGEKPRSTQYVSR